jgi:hypothetical protein
MLLELLAEIKRADIQVSSDGGQGNGLSVVLEQVLLGSKN